MMVIIMRAISHNNLHGVHAQIHDDDNHGIIAFQSLHLLESHGRSFGVILCEIYTEYTSQHYFLGCYTYLSTIRLC